MRLDDDARPIFRFVNGLRLRKTKFFVRLLLHHAADAFIQSTQPPCDKVATHAETSKKDAFKRKINCGIFPKEKRSRLWGGNDEPEELRRQWRRGNGIRLLVIWHDEEH